jgi:hypothetical protein
MNIKSREINFGTFCIDCAAAQAVRCTFGLETWVQFQSIYVRLSDIFFFCLFQLFTDIFKGTVVLLVNLFLVTLISFIPLLVGSSRFFVVYFIFIWLAA